MINVKSKRGKCRKNKKKNMVNGNNNSNDSRTVNQAAATSKSCQSYVKSAEGKSLTLSESHVLEQLVLTFLKSGIETQELEGLATHERKKIHFFARSHGLKTRSSNSNCGRILTLSRIAEYEPHIRLDQVSLFLYPDLIHIVSMALNELGRKRLSKPSPRQETDLPNGGLLQGIARIPPQQKIINSTLNAERENLPIFEKRGEILDYLNQSQVVIINGTTGSGKSTQVPQYLLEQATASERPIRIIVSQPRRIAAISLSSRIADERCENLGETVGFVIRMENNHGPKTALVFTTSGCLLRSLAIVGCELTSNTTHLIIDEVHDRDLNTDFLLLAIKMQLAQNKTLKLILMSATMDLDALSKYFGNAPVVNVKGRSFNVRVFPLEQVLSISGYTTPEMEYILALNGDEYQDRDEKQLLLAYKQAHSKFVQDIDNSLIISLLEMLLLIGETGAVIVYLPGYQDMMKLMDALLDKLPNDKIKILLLHSQVDSLQQKDVFRKYLDIKLKIVLSTNIGQTSITIPDLLYVIDAGRAKMKTFDSRTGASQLDCTWISQSDAQQRTGRAGRLTNGICYRLYSTDQFNAFSEFVVPEIKRCSLDEICLMAKVAMPIYPIEQFLSLSLDAPEPSAVAQSCSRLKLLQVLYDHDEAVTPLGHIIAQLPLDVQLAKCLVYGIYYSCFGSLSIITTFYSVRDPFVLPCDRSTRKTNRRPRQALNTACCSDSIAVLELYHQYYKISKSNHLADKFCEENQLCRKAMDMFVNAVATLQFAVKRLIKINHLTEVTRFDTDLNMVRLALTAGLYPNVVYIDRSNTKKARLIAEGEPSVQLSKNSTLKLNTFKTQTLSDWLLYSEKTRAGNNSHVQNVTLVSTLMIIIQCGKQVKLEPFHDDIDQDEVPTQQSLLSLDSWICIQVPSDFAMQLLKLRCHLTREFNEFVTNRSMQRRHCPTVDYIQQLLSNDSPYSGLYPDDIIFN